MALRRILSGVSKSQKSKNGQLDGTKENAARRKRKSKIQEGRC